MTFRPTIAWMQEKYNEMNQRLFNGVLGDCDFDIFTAGKGSQGRVLGKFMMTAKGIRIYVSKGMAMFKDVNFERIYIHSNNFVKLCGPKIMLNGNYDGSEKSFLSVLVHEMCHYYTYMDGIAPKQAHGPEFRRIAQIVSDASDGEFTVKRLADAEVMSGLHLSDEMAAKKDKRQENLKNRMFAFFVVTNSGKVELTTTTDGLLIEYLKKRFKQISKAINNPVAKVYIRNDKEMIDLLYNKGYRKNMRTYRVYNITDDEILNKLQDGVGEYNLKENKVSNDSIISEVINDYINTQTQRKADNSDEFVEIDPNMNLGIESAL